MILKGTLVHMPKPGFIEYLEGGCLHVQDGVITGISRQPGPADETADYGDMLILPGLFDMHVHASQYAMRGLGMDMPLLPWLNTYTFAEESKFADLSYAREVYATFIEAIIAAGTTHVLVYATLHNEATLLLMDMLEQRGLSAYVGKVNMDRNATLKQPTKQSIDETVAWLDACVGRYKHVRPILTPRFIPSCTRELLRALGRLAAQRGLPVQSHLSENEDEVRWISKLEPDSICYADAYDIYGLFGPGPVAMAHCVHCKPFERALMAQRGTLMVHCPDSNANLASGIADVQGMLEAGVSVALGSDIAAGTAASILDVMAKAVRLSKLHGGRTGQKPLTLEQVLYMATSAGAPFFGEQPGFAVGNPLHAVVLDDLHLLHTAALTHAERLQRMVYLHEDRHIAAVYANGKLLQGGLT